MELFYILYLAFILDALFGTTQRYFYFKETGGYPQKDPNKFTRVKMIDANMLTIPGVMALVAMIYILCFKKEKKTTGLIMKENVTSEVERVQKRKTFIRRLLPKWIFSFILFYTVYSVDNLLLAKIHKYDPSGHYLCAIVSYSNWLNLII